MPILLVTGDADLWIPPYLLRQVAAKIPNSKVVIVPEAGHSVQWEQPALFNDAVLDFIRTSALRGAPEASGRPHQYGPVCRGA